MSEKIIAPLVVSDPSTSISTQKGLFFGLAVVLIFVGVGFFMFIKRWDKRRNNHRNNQNNQPQRSNYNSNYHGRSNKGRIIEPEFSMLPFVYKNESETIREEASKKADITSLFSAPFKTESQEKENNEKENNEEEVIHKEITEKEAETLFLKESEEEVEKIAEEKIEEKQKDPIFDVSTLKIPGVTADELALKLRLAKEYLAIDDLENAKPLLDDIRLHGGEQEKTSVLRLLLEL